MVPLAFLVPLLAGIGISGVAAAVISGVAAIGLDLAASLLVGAIAGALTPQPGLKSTLNVGLSANDPRRMIIGRAATAGSLITFQTWGTNNEWIVLIFRVADHKCQGLAPQITAVGSTVIGSITVVVSSSAGMTVGMPFGGRGVPTGAWITAIIDATHITISQQASATFGSSTFVANAGVYYSGNPVDLGSGGAVPQFNRDGQDNCWVTFSNGDWNQTADADMVANSGGRWTSNSRGRGVAYVKVKARANAKAFPNGLSMLFQFVFVIDGYAMYDRRADSSVGGSGSQRFNDQSTWTLNSNSAVVAENLLRGVRVEDTSVGVGSRSMDTFYGLGLTDAALPFNENTAAMNHCDESITLNAGGTEPRYRCNGVIAPNSGDTLKTALGDVLITMSGKLSQSPGRLVLLAGVTQTPVRSFADADFRIDGPSKFVNDIQLDTIFNAVTGQFSDPASMYTGQPLPPRISFADAATDGGYKASTIDLSFVTSQTQGQRIQEIARRRQRLQITAQRAVAPENLDLEAGDWITWSSTRYATQMAGNDVFEIVQSDGKLTQDETENFLIVLDLGQVSSSLFSWNPATDELNRFSPAILPSASPVGVAVTTLTAAPATITSGAETKPVIAVTRDPTNDPTVIAVLYNYRVTGTTVQQQTPAIPVNPATESGTQSAIISAGIVGGVQHDVQAAFVTQPPQDIVFGSWVTTSTATAGTVADTVVNQAPAATDTTIAPGATVNQVFVQPGDPTTIQNGVSGMYAVPDGALWYNNSAGIDYRRVGGAWVAVDTPADGQIIYATGAPSVTYTFPPNSLPFAEIYQVGPGGGPHQVASHGGGGGGAAKVHISVVPGTTALAIVNGATGIGQSIVDGTAATAGGASTVNLSGSNILAVGGGAAGTSSAGGGGGTATAGDTLANGEAGDTGGTGHGGAAGSMTLPTGYQTGARQTASGTQGNLYGGGGSGGGDLIFAGPGITIIVAKAT